MIKVYSGFKGFAMFFLFMAGGILFLSFFFWGATAVIQFFMPLLVVMAYLLIIIFLFGVLPATYFKYMRPSLGVYSSWMSHALGAATWVMSFFIAIKAFGFLGALFIFSFKFLVAIALIGAMFKGAWHIVGHLAIWVGFTYGMRYYSQWVLHLNLQDLEKGRVIDVEAIEIRDH